MRAFLCFFDYHRWRVTHTNNALLPTRRVCRCGAIEEWRGGSMGGWHRSYTP